ncbi:hypothetical protein EGW08_006254 [Elysia chlorotica]|uniref:Uncharacterized protein n=1 Tax=Elysia chlorotica TaxID=188477 RepID=A0A433TWK8_ELYCH|nr:hypothetical protein EGW08_006254 [Elysia chlorotica]
MYRPSPRQFSQPPPYGADPTRGCPMTTQPQCGNRRYSLTAPPQVAPKTVSMYPDDNAPSTNNGGVINNVNTNNNSSSSNNSVVVNANVTAGAGLGTGNRLCLVGKDMLRSRDWNSGLFSCLNDVFGCTFSLLCFPLTMMRLSNRLNECACVPCCVPGGMIALRTKLRVMGGIKGSVAQDCMATHFCCWCVACQMTREMNDMDL